MEEEITSIYLYDEWALEEKISSTFLHQKCGLGHGKNCIFGVLIF